MLEYCCSNHDFVDVWITYPLLRWLLSTSLIVAFSPAQLRRDGLVSLVLRAISDSFSGS